MVVTTAATEEISKFAMLTAEAVDGIATLEASHAADPALGAAMVCSSRLFRVALVRYRTASPNTPRIALG